jgi:lipopolysaccharide biosynthesis glycosyltransferase
MREDDLTRRALGWVERYGFHDQDVMLAYGGGQRRTLEPRWNALPVHEDVENPAIVHWAALAKPWDPELTFAKDEWRSFAESLARRAAGSSSG